MFKKRKKTKECPEKTPALIKAEEISKKYKQLSNCCEVISKITNTEDTQFIQMYAGGYKVYKNEIINAGINIDEVYEYILKLVRKRKIELEIELSKLDE